MSLKLLKQSVGIIEEGFKATTEKNKDKQSHGSVGKKVTLQNKIRRDHHSGHPQKKTIKDVQKELQARNNKSNENVRRLLALSMNTVKLKDAEEIVQRAHKGRYVKKIIPKVVQESIFTEEDFRKFEEEYFHS